MKKVLKILLVFFMLVLMMSLSVYLENSGNSQKADTDESTGHIKSATAINEVFADGQKVTAVAVEYDKDIDNSKLTTSTFSVDGKNIRKVYANTEAAKASQGVNGKYVIIELSTDYQNPLTTRKEWTPSSGSAPKAASSESSQTQTQTHPGLTLSVNHGGDGLSISLTQVGNVITTDGVTYASSSQAIDNEKDTNLVIDDFLKPEYKPEGTMGIKYNLYVPKDYDASKSYPLVLFIQDEGSCNGKYGDSLIQGLGGVIWAEPSEQAKHECFVIVPSYHAPVVNDNFETLDDLDMTVDAIKSLETQYSIDPNRMYITGQSAGCMGAIDLNIKYPNMFAASLLVAGQWESKAMSQLNKANMWIINSESDEKTYSGMNADIASLEAAGAKISKATWNGQASESEFSSDVSKMISEGNNIKYTVLKKGTVVPSGESDNVDNNHAYTWRIAYSIEGLRDWLFTQTKTSK